MKTINHIITPIILAATAILTACSVDFSPNADWKEIPVVYCLIDQDDSITSARVEKCYLTQGDIFPPGRISDSINYPQGAITVALLAFDDNGSIVDSIPLHYTEIDHQPGNFASTAQPIYQNVTKGRLRDEWSYQIRVRHTDDGCLIASSHKPVPLVTQTSQTVINKPSYTEFNGTRSGQFSFNRPGSKCLIEWDTLRNGRRYQPVIRLYYSVAGDTTFVDVRAGMQVSRGNSQTLYIDYPREQFLAGIKDKLSGDTAPKRYLKMVDIYLTVSSEDFNAYMASLEAGASLSHGREPYTNIDGGLGVFASRRTHLYKWMPADSSTLNNGLPAKLRELGVGFE